MDFGHDGAPVMVRIPPDPALSPERQNWQAAWPHQGHLELAAVAEAVPSARHHVRLVLKEWRAGDLALSADQAYDIEQITAELVANALAATRAVQWAAKQPPIRLWLLGARSQAMAVVWDGTTAIPIPRLPNDDEDSGRGLLLVGALARWGYYLASPGYGGKVVYARLPK